MKLSDFKPSSVSEWFLAATILMSITGIAEPLIRQRHIKKNLEDRAILCKMNDNSNFMKWGRTYPVLRNEDINDNDKYESIIIRKLPSGDRVYQEVSKARDGSLLLGEQKPYK